MKKVFSLLVVLTLALGLVGCSGGFGVSDEDADKMSAGKVMIKNVDLNGNKQVKGSVAINDSEDNEKASGQVGDTFTVSAGTYTAVVEVEVEGSTFTAEKEVVVKEGDTNTVAGPTIEYGTLNVVLPDGSSTGTVTAGDYSGKVGTAFALPLGDYDITVNTEVNGQSVVKEVSGVTIEKAKENKKEVKLALGTATVDLAAVNYPGTEEETLDMTKVDLTFKTAGGAQVVAGKLVGEEVVLPAGDYTVDATSSEFNAYTFEGKGISVTAGENTSQTFDLPEVILPTYKVTYNPDLDKSGYSDAPTPSDEVHLVGGMNGWDPSNKDYALTDDDNDGIWTGTFEVAKGTNFKFIIDGDSWDSQFGVDTGNGGTDGGSDNFSIDADSFSDEVTKKSKDEIPPAVVNAVVKNTSRNKITLEFSEAVTATDVSGFSISGTSASISALGSNDDDAVLTLDLDQDVAAADSVTVSYDKSAGDVTDTSAQNNPLDSFSAETVENKIIVTGITIDGVKGTDYDSGKSYDDGADDMAVTWTQELGEFSITNDANFLYVYVKQDVPSSGSTDQWNNVAVFVDGDNNATTGVTDFTGNTVGLFDNEEAWMLSALGADFGVRTWNDGHLALGDMGNNNTDVTTKVPYGSQVGGTSTGHQFEIAIPLSELDASSAGDKIKLSIIKGNDWADGSQLLDIMPNVTTQPLPGDATPVNIDMALSYTLQ